MRATFCTLSMEVEQRRGRGTRSRVERGSSHTRLEKYLKTRGREREREIEREGESNEISKGIKKGKL